jgi:hypothetical protein
MDWVWAIPTLLAEPSIDLSCALKFFPPANCLSNFLPISQTLTKL